MKRNNPIVGGWYADPEARTYGGAHFIYVTRSLPFGEQKNLDCVVLRPAREPEIVSGIVDMSGFPYVTHAVWAPTVIEKDGKFYLIFASNNIQKNGETGGLEIAVSDDPRGPFCAMLGRPLLGRFVYGAQPIDAHLFKDDDGQIYLYFGGWGHCVLAKMNADMTGFLPLGDGETFREITPDGYVEGPCMLKRGGKYHFMYSVGNWTDGSYGVCTAVSDSPEGPFTGARKILYAQPPVADGPGHNGYLQIGERFAIVYHRRTVGDLNPHHRQLCIDELLFDDKGDMLPVKMT